MEGAGELSAPINFGKYWSVSPDSLSPCRPMDGPDQEQMGLTFGTVRHFIFGIHFV